MRRASSGDPARSGHAPRRLTDRVLGLDGGCDLRRLAQAVPGRGQDSEHVRLPLGEVEDGVPRGPHGHLGVDPLPAAAPNHGLQGGEAGPVTRSPGCPASWPRERSVQLTRPRSGGARPVPTN